MTRAFPTAGLLPLLALAACNPFAAWDPLSKVREESLAERCGDVMQQAFPGGEITVTKTAVVPVETQSIATIVTAAEGVRKELPATSPLLREVAVECRFNDGILTSFRWTKGPLR